MTDKKEADVRSLNLYQKLAAISGEVGIIAKDGQNREQNFKFIEYAAVAGRLRDLFAKYGVVVVPSMPPLAEQQRQSITTRNGKAGVSLLMDMTFDVINTDKPEDRFTVTWTAEAADYGDKATNKAATGALKYYLMRQFNISEKGEDPDAESPDRGETQPAEPPQKQPAPKREPSVKDLVIYAGELLERQGVTEPADKSAIVLGIAGVVDKSLLTLNKIKLVIKTLRDEDIESLKSLYLISPDADKQPDDDPAEQIDEENMDLVALAARKAEQDDKTWVIPSFKPADLARPEQRALIKKWVEQLEADRPGSTVNLVPSLIHKDKVGTFDEAMAVLHWLADELNKIADEQKEAL